MFGKGIDMNDQLSEQLQQSKAEEWQRHLAGYIAANHNPDVPENRPQFRAQARVVPSQPRANNMSWRNFSKFMGVDPHFLYQLGPQEKAA
jgi:hypothetical protein